MNNTAANARNNQAERIMEEAAIEHSLFLAQVARRTAQAAN